jgi:hypothetical protein
MTVTVTEHEATEFSKAATAMYARGENATGHLLSAVAAKRSTTIEQYDRAAKAYREWLVFNEPKPTRSFAVAATRINASDRVWMVYPATPTSELADVLGEDSLVSIALQGKAGYSMEEIRQVVMFVGPDAEAAARAEAVRRLEAAQAVQS